MTLHRVLDRALATSRRPTGRPTILAVDGRGGAGKSTLAARLHEQVSSSAVLHTDDLAWHEPYFGWGHLLTRVLDPLHRDEPVHFQPPAWPAHGREGAIEISAGLDLVIVEGNAASQRAAAPLLDAAIWMQSDVTVAKSRGIERDVAEGVNGDLEQASAFWEEWAAAEFRFFAEDRPWERADLIVAGTPPITVSPGEWAVAVPER